MKKWIILFSVGLMIFMVNLDFTIATVAVAPIAKDLHVSINSLQWMFSGFSLACTLFFAVFGRLADMFGRRRIFIIGSLIFTLASLGCALSTSYTWLIIFRFIQGMGMSGTLGLALVIVAGAFPPEQRGTATGTCTLLTGTGQAIGPTLGGVLIHYFSWHAIFMVNVPLGAITIILTWIFVNKDHLQGRRPSIDGVGVMMFAFGIGAIALAFNEFVTWDPAYVAAAIIIGVLLLLFFYRKSKQRSNPFISLKLLHNKDFLKVSICRFLFMYSWLGLMFLLPLYMENIVGYSTLATGNILFAMTVAIAAVSTLSGKVSDKFGYKVPVVISLVIAFLACVGFAFLPQQPQLLIFLLVLVVAGISVGMHLPSTIHGVVITAPGEHRAAGMGVFFTIGFLGATIGVALAGVLMAYRSHMIALQLLQQAGITLKMSDLSQYFSVVSGSQSPSILHNILSAAQFNQLVPFAKQSFMTAFRDIMYVDAVLLAFAIWLGFTLPTKKTA